MWTVSRFLEEIHWKEIFSDVRDISKACVITKKVYSEGDLISKCYETLAFFYNVRTLLTQSVLTVDTAVLLLLKLCVATIVFVFFVTDEVRAVTLLTSVPEVPPSDICWYINCRGWVFRGFSYSLQENSRIFPAIIPPVLSTYSPARGAAEVRWRGKLQESERQKLS